MPLDETLAFVELQLLPRIVQGELLYLHCRMGNGRTGVLAAIVLGCLYPSLSPQECLLRVQAYHRRRQTQPDLPTPQNQRQRELAVDAIRAFRSRQPPAPSAWPGVKDPGDHVGAHWS